MRKLLLLFAILFVTPLLLAGTKPKMEDVASRLSCYCGTCPHLVVTQCGCGTAEQIKVDVQKMIDSGMTPDQIVQSYVNKYGATVLAAPPKSGFSLTAWVFPFLGFLSGSALLVVYLRRQKADTAVQSPARTEQTGNRYRDELERELEQIK